MASFNRHVWRSKPPIGTPLSNGLFAPDRLAVPFNELSLGDGFLDYANAPQGSVKGVLSSASNAALSQGRNGPVFSSTITSTNVTFTKGCALLPTTQATFVIGYNKRDSTARGSVAFGNNTAGGAGRANVYLPFSDGVTYWDWEGTGGTQRLSIAGLSFGGYDIWAFTTGPRGMEIWRNGQLVTSNANNATRTQVATNDFFLGSDGSGTADLVDWDFIYVYSTQIPPAQIQALSILPFSVFQPYRNKFWSPNTSGAPTPINETLSDTITLSDSITTLIIGVILETLNDSISLSDSIATSLTNEIDFNLSLSDLITISDSINLDLDYWIKLFDSISLSDSIVRLLQSIFSVSDTITLSDSLVIHGDTPQEFSDRIILSDLVSVSAPATTGISDTISLSDTARIVLEIHIIVNDSLNLSDSINQVVTLLVQINVGSSFSLSDSITILLSSNDTNYIRAYLNDVQGIRTPETISDPADEGPGDLNDYLRRYLNDVSD